MKSYFKILLILLFSVVVTVLTAPLIASIFPFHLYRVMSRILLVIVFVSAYYYKDSLGFTNWQSIGLDCNRRWWGWLGVGFFVALFSGGLIAALMILNSIRFLIPGLSDINWCLSISHFILTAVIVALIEECFFRGFIFQSLLKDSPVFLSILFTNLFYSLVHFLKPQALPVVEVLNLTNSFNGVVLFFQPVWQNWVEIWPAFIGLFLVGIVLSLAYLRTGSLALSIGLHAGWIVVIKTISLTTDVTRLGSLWVKGKVLNNPITWGMLVLLILILSWQKKPLAPLSHQYLKY